MLDTSSGGGAHDEVKPMQEAIQPKYGAFSAHCSCGNVIKTRSTMMKEIHLDVCSECHPFYTGKQKNSDVGGRIDRFKKRFSGMRSSKEA